MRIAIDCRYIRERPSGIGAYVRGLVDRLPERSDREFVLWTHRLAPRPLARASNAREVVVRGGPTSPVSLYWPRLHASFDGIQLLHNPHSVLPSRVPCPSVVTIHDVLALDSPRLHRPGIERIRGLYYPQALVRALRLAARLIVMTTATADRVLFWMPDARRRLRVIPLAAASLFHPASDPKAAQLGAAAMIGSDAPYVLVVGENTVNKSHDVALAAFASGAPAEWRIVFVQRLGSARGLKRAADRLGLSGRATWLGGATDDTQVATLMQAASVLIHPSRYEGFGLPFLEAMACACPVIASDIPPLREVAGGAALLAPPGEVGAFASALRRIAESRGLHRELMEAGVTRAAAFSWDRTARETFSIYDELSAAR